MSYQILPFRFSRFNEEEYFLSNEVGEFLFLNNKEFNDYVNNELNSDSNVFFNLKSKQFLADTDVNEVIDMLAVKYRTKKASLDNFTALHMVVPTLRCNSNCIYCQVSRKDIDDKSVDMDKHTASKILSIIFKSPSPNIKIEFQGGDPLLNFPIVQYFIEKAELINIYKKKNLEFVVCSNLTLIDEKMLKYIKKHNVYISTSLDGPIDIHNHNRPLQKTNNTFDILLEKLELSRKYLGKDYVSALMTTTSYNINRFKEIIDEYVKLGFYAIFLRSLNPYGFALRDKHKIAYPMELFIEKYKEALNYIIEINKKGIFLVEGFAKLLLTRILTPFSTGFVDLQSPAGTAISGVIYDYNGNVYVSDEARMMAATNNHRFLMGNVKNHTYEELFNSEFIKSVINDYCLECLPICSECAYQSYCGADPVRNYSEQNDIIGHRPTSNICKKNMSIIKHIINLIKEDNYETKKIFWSWINLRIIN